MVDKESTELVDAINAHPTFPVIYFCETDGIWDEYNSQRVEIKSVVVDRVTIEIDDERMYLREDDRDDIIDGPWSTFCEDDEDKWASDEEFEKWLDQFEWADAIVVMMGAIR